MKLNAYISVIRADEVVHIIEGDKSRFIGKIANAYAELNEDYLNNAKVIDVFTGFSGLCIEAVTE